VEDGLPDPSSNLPSLPTRRERLLVLILVALAPLILGAVLCYYAAERVARREAGITSIFIVNQVSAIVEEARIAVQRLVPHAGDPCEQLMQDLAVAAAAAPYVRTINIIEGDHSSCSSAFGNQSIPIGSLKDAFPRVPGIAWMALVRTTPFVPRQALLIAEPAPGGRTVLAVVDDRYLIDLMRAAAPVDMYSQVELRFAQSPPLSETSLAAPPDNSLLLVNVRKETGTGAFELRIYGLRSRELATLRGLLLNYMPWAAALSALLVWLVWRVQHSRSPRREVLLRAIRANEFHVEYQPLYGVNVGHCEGVEALLRWVRPGHGAVRPDEFIAFAEEERVIIPLTQHLLTLIARDFATINVQPGFHIGVNFAPEHLSSGQMTDDIRALRAALGPHGPRIAVEITERTLIRNTEQAKCNLESLRAEGVQVAIDDFGTGYCSLSYLERFPFDWLKIDRGFVLTIDPGVTRAVVLDAIIDLAHTLGAELVAEGVETMAQFDYLRAHGVAFIQGYLYAQPMKPDVFARWYHTLGMQVFPAVRVPTAQ
jgi:sensor c-di-GMP phosphodiesterase-like protein